MLFREVLDALQTLQQWQVSCRFHHHAQSGSVSTARHLVLIVDTTEADATHCSADMK